MSLDLDVETGDAHVDSSIQDDAGDVDTAISQDTLDSTDITDADTDDDSDGQQILCSADEDCIPLASPPCTVATCENSQCRTFNVSVPCDDHNWCTTGDQCTAGVCKGRPFSPDESKNWVTRIAGTGEFAVIDHVVHPSGESTLVGAFEGELDVPGRLPLTSSGGFDAFLLRFHQSGAVVQAFAWGGPDHEAPVHIAVDGEDVYVAWGERALDFSTGPTFQSARILRSYSALAGTAPLHGKPHGVDVATNGSVFVASVVESTIQIPITNGGITILDPSSGINGFIGAFSSGVARWLHPVTGIDTEAIHHVLSLAEQNVAVLRLKPGARIGSTQIVATSATAAQVWAVSFDINTGVIGQRGQLGAGWDYAFSAYRFERSSVAFVTSTRLDATSLVGVHVGQDPISPECQPTVTLLSADTVYSSAVPTEAGGVLALFVTGGLTVDIGRGVSLPAGPHSLALAAYDPGCLPHRVVPLGFNLGEAHPAPVHRAGVLLGASSKLRGTRGGRVYLSGPLREVTTPGPIFPGSVLVPSNEFEAYFASIGPKDLLGCETSPQ